MAFSLISVVCVTVGVAEYISETCSLMNHKHLVIPYALARSLFCLAIFTVKGVFLIVYSRLPYTTVDGDF